jgi:WD repeat-containing protein 19
MQAGLKKAAYTQACVLIRPENIDSIPPKFKSKVEGLARRPVKTEDEPEPLSPCPYCKFDLPEYKLDCPKCKNIIPFCLASGKHIVLTDFAKCPRCDMAANYTDYKRMLESEPICASSGLDVNPMQLKISDDPQKEFKDLTDLLKDSTNAKEDEEGKEGKEGAEAAK